MFAHVGAHLPGSTVGAATNGRIRWLETVMRSAATVAECSGGTRLTSIPDVYACLARRLREQDHPGEGQVEGLLNQYEEIDGEVQVLGEGHMFWLVHPSVFWTSPLLCPLCHSEQSAHSSCLGWAGGEPYERVACAATVPPRCLCQHAEVESAQKTARTASFTPLLDTATQPLLLPSLKEWELNEARLEGQVLEKLLRFVEEHDLFRLLNLTADELSLACPTIERLCQQQQERLEDRRAELEDQNLVLLEMQQPLAQQTEPGQEKGGEA